MSEATLRAAVYAAVDGVTDSGKVYDYQRWSNDWTALLALFQDTIDSTAQIRAWTVSSEAISPKQLAIQRLTRRTFTFRVRGFMGVDDSAATEKTFAALVEAVLNALDDDATLHADTAHVGYAGAEPIGYITMGGVLCHYCEIVQQVAETRTAAV